MFLARLKKELARRALVCHLLVHALFCVLWFATAIAVIDFVAHAKRDSYTKVRRDLAEAPGRVADSAEGSGLVPTAGGLGFVVG